jgi:hypothetical protein
VSAGVAPGGSDNMVLDIQNGKSASGYGHPSCKGGKPSDDTIEKLGNDLPIGPQEIGVAVGRS